MKIKNLIKNLLKNFAGEKSVKSAKCGFSKRKLRPLYYLVLLLLTLSLGAKNTFCAKLDLSVSNKIKAIYFSDLNFATSPINKSFYLTQASFGVALKNYLPNCIRLYESLIDKLKDEQLNIILFKLILCYIATEDNVLSRMKLDEMKEINNFNVSDEYYFLNKLIDNVENYDFINFVITVREYDKLKTEIEQLKADINND